MTRRQALQLAVPMAITAAEPTWIVRLDGTKLQASQADREIQRLMAAARVTGLAVAVFNDARPVYQRAFGLRHVEKKLPLTIDTSMSGLSWTKSVFAFVVMQLMEEGVFDLDRPLQSYLPKPLPEYEDYRDLAGDPRYEKITGRMALTHTPGFPNWRFLLPDGKLRILFEPGSTYAYSGEGITLLQLAVEAATGKSAGELMQTRVFNRFGMTRTAMTWQAEWEADFATGYDEQGRQIGRPRRSRPRAAGSMDTTLADISKFTAAALLRREGLRPATWKAMLSRQVAIRSLHQFPSLENRPTTKNDAIQLGYGLGWGVFTTPFGSAFFKEGHDDGWENHLVCYEKNRTAVALMSNSANGDSIFKELLEVLVRDRWTPWEWEGYVPYNQR